jgi:hypothetical protein
VRYYDRQGNEISYERWTDLNLRGTSYWLMAETRIDDRIPVSTVWIGMNLGADDDNPLIFQTQIWAGPLKDTTRYSRTEAEAIEGHREMVALAAQAVKTASSRPVSRPTREQVVYLPGDAPGEA